MVQSYQGKRDSTGGMIVTQMRHTAEEIGRIGREIYDRDIRPKVMPQHKGKFLILDIHTGQYEIDEDDLKASDRLRARVPDGEFYGLRIGYTAAYSLGGGRIEEE